MISPRLKARSSIGAGHLRSALRLAILGMCLPAVLNLVSSECAAGNFSPDENKREKPYALIFGTVWGPDAHPLYGVKIKLRRESEEKARWELYSDRNGEFAFRVPVGPQDYLLWADLKGSKSKDYNQLQAAEVKVHVDGDERVDTGLHLK